MNNPQQGNPEQGNPQQGNPQQGNSQQGNSQQGNPQQVNNPQQGNNQQGGIKPPQQGGNNPQQGGNNPQQVGNNPQQGGNSLQQGGNNPQQGGNNPQQGSNNPQQGGNNPQQGGNNPQQGGTNPQQGGNNPQQGGNSPQQGGNNPQQGGNNPQQGGTNPQQGGNNPQQGGNSLQQGGNNPQQGGNNPQQGGNRPQQGGNNPQQGGNNSQQGGNNSQQGGNNPQQGGNNPQQEGNNPQQGGDNPQQGGTNPQQGGNNPQQGGNNPQQGGNNPQQGGNNPQQGGNTPQQGGNNPQQGGNNLQQGGNNPQQGGNNPQQGGNNQQQGNDQQGGTNQQGGLDQGSSQQENNNPGAVTNQPLGINPQGVNNQAVTAVPITVTPQGQVVPQTGNNIQPGNTPQNINNVQTTGKQGGEVTQGNDGNQQGGNTNQLSQNNPEGSNRPQEGINSKGDMSKQGGENSQQGSSDEVYTPPEQQGVNTAEPISRQSFNNPTLQGRNIPRENHPPMIRSKHFGNNAQASNNMGIGNNQTMGNIQQRLNGGQSWISMRGVNNQRINPLGLKDINIGKNKSFQSIDNNQLGGNYQKGGNYQNVGNIQPGAIDSKLIGVQLGRRKQQLSNRQQGDTKQKATNTQPRVNNREVTWGGIKINKGNIPQTVETQQGNNRVGDKSNNVQQGITKGFSVNPLNTKENNNNIINRIHTLPTNIGQVGNIKQTLNNQQDLSSQPPPPNPQRGKIILGRITLQTVNTEQTKKQQMRKNLQEGFSQIGHTLLNKMYAVNNHQATDLSSSTDNDGVRKILQGVINSMGSGNKQRENNIQLKNNPIASNILSANDDQNMLPSLNNRGGCNVLEGCNIQNNQRISGRLNNIHKGKSVNIDNIFTRRTNHTAENGDFNSLRETLMNVDETGHQRGIIETSVNTIPEEPLQNPNTLTTSEQGYNLNGNENAIVGTTLRNRINTQSISPEITQNQGGIENLPSTPGNIRQQDDVNSQIFTSSRIAQQDGAANPSFTPNGIRRNDELVTLPLTPTNIEPEIGLASPSSTPSRNQEDSEIDSQGSNNIPQFNAVAQSIIPQETGSNTVPENAAVSKGENPSPLLCSTPTQQTVRRKKDVTPGLTISTEGSTNTNILTNNINNNCIIPSLNENIQQGNNINEVQRFTKGGVPVVIDQKIVNFDVNNVASNQNLPVNLQGKLNDIKSIDLSSNVVMPPGGNPTVDKLSTKNTFSTDNNPSPDTSNAGQIIASIQSGTKPDLTHNFVNFLEKMEGELKIDKEHVANELVQKLNKEAKFVPSSQPSPKDKDLKMNSGSFEIGHDTISQDITSIMDNNKATPGDASTTMFALDQNDNNNFVSETIGVKKTTIEKGNNGIKITEY